MALLLTKSHSRPFTQPGRGSNQKSTPCVHPADIIQRGDDGNSDTAMWVALQISKWEKLDTKCHTLHDSSSEETKLRDRQQTVLLCHLIVCQQ